MKNQVSKLVLGVSLCVLLFSCSNSSVFSESIAFPNNEWTLESKPVFKVTIPDTAKFYTVDITVRTSTSYPFNNLWFFLHTKTPNGQAGREPIEVKIAHPDGSWVGEKSGTIVTTSVHFSHRKFPQKGDYVFTLEQGITEKSIPEILDISYTVTEDQAK